MVKITFPDGSVREYNEGVTGLQIAESISSRLAQDVLACGGNGETVYRSTLLEAVSYYEENLPKGECVLVIEGLSREEIEQEEQKKWSNLSIEEHMEYYLSQGIDKKEAMKKTAKDRGVQKREIYNYLEKLKSGEGN